MAWLRVLRLESGKTQDEVATNARVSRGAYANIESGERRPSVDTAKRIAAVLGFEWTRFFEDEHAS